MGIMEAEKTQQFLINTLSLEGYQILRVTENEESNHFSWWIINTFEPSGEGSNLNPYHVVEGYQVTSIFDMYANFDKHSLINRVRDFVQNNPVLRMKFHMNYKWKLYVSTEALHGQNRGY